MRKKIKSLDDLKVELTRFEVSEKLDKESYKKARYVSFEEFKALECLELDFEPYTSIATKCAMSACGVYRSRDTSRFYIGYTNLGGHGARWEIRPVTPQHILDPKYIELMYANHSQEIHYSLDLNEKYKV